MATPKWPETLVVVRHGESEQNVALDIHEGSLENLAETFADKRDADIELTEKGVFQAQQTGILLAENQPFDMCYASPYARTFHTAQGIVSNLQYPLEIRKDNRLREKEFGRMHGLTKFMKEQFPEEYRIRQRDGKYWYRLPGGENYPDVEMRIHSFLDKLARDYGGKRVLIVTHHVPYVLFRALFEHLDEKKVLELGDVPNCAIATYTIDTTKVEEGRMKLRKWNEIAYKISDHK